MCGITGILDEHHRYPVSEALMVQMANELVHRGPDEFSCFVDGNMGFGFRRLSIVDLLNGHQPFFSNDQSLVLICNGEIFNHRELRTELEAKGCQFKTHCDVEVIVHLYSVYGTDFLNRLNGQFAFAIFDKKSSSIFLARDQFGICPLFYTCVDGLFVFASEIKAIIKHPLIERKVNLEGLDQVFTFPGLVSPVTMFKDIFSLPPGNFMIVRNGRTEISEYWDLNYPVDAPVNDQSESFYSEQLEELLLKSVKCRLNAEVPIGFYLSGGLDSSLIGALMKTVTPDVSYPSFSIGFPTDPEMSEHAHQCLMTTYLQFPNTKISFGSSEIEQRLKEAIWASESALKESYNTCSLALSESAKRQGIKVILSGEGSDELFGGYVGYRFDKQRNNHQGVKDMEEQMEDEYRRKLWGDADFFYEKNYYEFTDIKSSLYSEKAREMLRNADAVDNLVLNRERLAGRHVLHKRSYVDFKLRLCDHLIADHCDRVTYSNSIEGRYPFLDIDLVEFVKTIPPDIKLKGLTEKYILKKTAEKYLPAAIVNRQKFGFVAPGTPSLLRKNLPWIEEMLSFERISRQGYFNPHVVEHLKKVYKEDSFRLNLPFESDMLIVVLTFNIFLELFSMPDL